MGLQENGIEKSAPSIEDVSGLAQKLLGNIVGGQIDQIKSAVAALRAAHERIDRLNEEVSRANADRLRMVSALNNANSRCAAVEDEYQKLHQKYVELVRRVVENENLGVSVNERIEAAIFSSEVSRAVGEDVDLMPSHIVNFANPTASHRFEIQ